MTGRNKSGAAISILVGGMIHEVPIIYRSLAHVGVELLSKGRSGRVYPILVFSGSHASRAHAFRLEYWAHST